MTVKLVAITKPLIEEKEMNAEEFISYVARVSNPSNQLNTESSPKLIKYLIQNKHWSPLELVNLTMEIKTTRGLAAQILRHRSFVFQEFCISGDSLITTILPTSGSPNYISIEKLYKKQHNKNYEGILLRVYDENKKEFTSAPLREVFKTGVKSCFKITFEDGKSIKTTKEHKFLTKTGFESLEEALGIEIHNNKVTMHNPKELAVNGIPCYQSHEWLKLAKSESIENKTGVRGIAERAGVSYHTIRKWLRVLNLKFSKAEITSYVIPRNKGKTGYKNKPKTEEQKLHMRNITPKGKDHYAYKGGGASERKAIANYFNKFRKEIYQNFNFKCQMCFENFNTFDGKIDIHHIKEVSLYPELSLDINNVIPVHKKCHMEYHGKTYSYTEIRKKHKGNTLAPRFKKVINIEYVGEIETYDLEVEHPSHNYVANKIVVHNSQRYSKSNKFQEVEARRQDKKNRQNSIDDMDIETKDWFKEIQTQIWNDCYSAYEIALEKGIAREQARFLLPLNTETTIYMSGSLRSWLHYIDLRKSNGTQLEHQRIALQCLDIIKQHFPNVSEAMSWS